jgi:hypothetical protein
MMPKWKCVTRRWQQETSAKLAASFAATPFPAIRYSPASQFRLSLADGPIYEESQPLDGWNLHFS